MPSEEIAPIVSEIDTQVEQEVLEDQASPEELTQDQEPLELSEEEPEVVQPEEEDIQLEETESEASTTEEEVAEEITEKDSDDVEDREELAPAPIEMPEIETVAEEQPILPSQE